MYSLASCTQLEKEHSALTNPPLSTHFQPRGMTQVEKDGRERPHGVEPAPLSCMQAGGVQSGPPRVVSWVPKMTATRNVFGWGPQVDKEKEERGVPPAPLSCMQAVGA